MCRIEVGPPVFAAEIARISYVYAGVRLPKRDFVEALAPTVFECSLNAVRESALDAGI